jgi:hypothetical protein
MAGDDGERGLLTRIDLAAEADCGLAKARADDRAVLLLVADDFLVPVFDELS